MNEWDKRYSESGYAYGTEPNDFLKQNFSTIPKGKVLSIAEGEGRNAVFLAKQGYHVTAIDSSIVAINKAEQLARQHQVDINFIHHDLLSFDFGENQWEGIVSIFLPIVRQDRLNLYPRLTESLKNDGVFLMEAYTPEQINFGTGGGKDSRTMQTVDTITSELLQMNFLRKRQLERVVKEGKYHTGLASVLQVIAKKP